MSRRGGQSGTVVKKGNWWHGRYYIDIAGSTKRARKSVAIGHSAEMTKPEAKRKLAVMLNELGVNDNSYLEKALIQSSFSPNTLSGGKRTCFPCTSRHRGTQATTS